MKRSVLIICVILITVVMLSPIAIAKKSTAPVVTQQMERFCFSIVDDATGEPMIGASVQVKGTTRGAMADMDGKVCINVKPGEVLIISYIGYKSVEYTYKGQSTATIRLVADNEELL